MAYNDVVLDHFNHPRNVGELEQPDAEGTIGSPVCGDVTIVQLRILGDRIMDIRFKTFGCAAAIASSSMLTELVKGKTLAEAETIDTDQIVAALGGLPDYKIHCSVLAADALRAAIADYRGRHRADVAT